MYTWLLSKPQTHCLGCRLEQDLAAFPQERVTFTSLVTDLSSVAAGGWEEPHVGGSHHEDFTGHPSTLRPNDHPVLRCTSVVTHQDITPGTWRTPEPLIWSVAESCRREFYCFVVKVNIEGIMGKLVERRDQKRGEAVRRVTAWSLGEGYWAHPRLSSCLWLQRPPVPWQMMRPWCWGRLRAGGEGDDRGWDGWMASPTQWRWVWVNSGSWWWTGRPGVLRFMGSQRVGRDWATEQTVRALTPVPELTPTLDPATSQRQAGAILYWRLWVSDEPGFQGCLEMLLFLIFLFFSLWGRGRVRKFPIAWEPGLVIPAHIPLQCLIPDFAHYGGCLLRMHRIDRSGIHGCVQSPWRNQNDNCLSLRFPLLWDEGDNCMNWIINDLVLVKCWEVCLCPINTTNTTWKAEGTVTTKGVTK